MRVGLKLALSAVVLVAGLSLAEGGCRSALVLGGTPFDSGAVAAVLRREREATRTFATGIGTRGVARNEPAAFGILHPFIGSESEHDKGGVLEHFRKGTPPDEFSVVVVGGSVAAQFVEAQGSALEAALDADPRLRGRHAKVLNYAHRGHKEPQQLMHVAWLLCLGYRPDVVINLDGFNEVALACENATKSFHPLYPTYSAWGVLVENYGAMDPRALDLTLELWKVAQEIRKLIDVSLSWKLHHSALASRLVLSRLHRIQVKRVELQEELNSRSVKFAADEAMRRQLGGPDFEGAPDAVLRLCIRGWAEASRSLHEMCAGRGILYIHMLQPALGDKGSKPLTPREAGIAGPSEWWIRGPELAYGSLREEGTKLALEGEAFVDATQIFAGVEADVYFDPCHFLPEGYRILGEAMADATLERIPPK